MHSCPQGLTSPQIYIAFGIFAICKCYNVCDLYIAPSGMLMNKRKKEDQLL